MTMVASSDSFSIDGSHPTAKPPINSSHHGQDPNALQRPTAQATYKTRHWLIWLITLGIARAPILLLYQNCTSPHNFESIYIQKHPFFPVNYTYPLLQFTMNMSTRSGRGNGHVAATPSPLMKNLKSAIHRLTWHPRKRSLSRRPFK